MYEIKKPQLKIYRRKVRPAEQELGFRSEPPIDQAADQPFYRPFNLILFVYVGEVELIESDGGVKPRSKMKTKRTINLVAPS